MKMNGNSRDILHLMAWATLARRIRRAHACDRRAFSQEFQLLEDANHATGQASFDAETHKQGRRGPGAGCRRIRLFAGGERIRIHHAHRRHPAIRQYIAQSALRSWRRGNGRRQSRHVLSLRQGKQPWQRRAAGSRMRRLRPRLRRRLPGRRRLRRRLPGRRLRLPDRRLRRLWVRRLRRLPRLQRVRLRHHCLHCLRRGLRGLCRLRGLLPVLGIVPLVLSPACVGITWPTIQESGWACLGWRS